MLKRDISSAMISVAAIFTAAGCSGGGEDVSNSVTADRGIGNAAVAAVEVPDACTFFSRAELETTVGWELREGEPRDASAGSSCEFESPPAMYAKRTFPNPALPGSVGFSSLTITTYPSQATFAQGRGMPDAEGVPGLGDDAYFNGSNLLQVRVGSGAFSVRIYTDAESPADWAKVRAVMLTLGRTGASRL